MIYLKTPEDIEKMRNACALVSRTLGEIAKWVAPGVTTHKIDAVAREFISDNGGKAACLGYGGFPGLPFLRRKILIPSAQSAPPPSHAP